MWFNRCSSWLFHCRSFMPCTLRRVHGAPNFHANSSPIDITKRFAIYTADAKPDNITVYCAHSVTIGCSIGVADKQSVRFPKCTSILVAIFLTHDVAYCVANQRTNSLAVRITNCLSNTIAINFADIWPNRVALGVADAKSEQDSIQLTHPISNRLADHKPHRVTDGIAHTVTHIPSFTVTVECPHIEPD
jgi:hypothetical protein